MPSAAVAPIKSLARVDIGRKATSAYTACTCASTLLILITFVTALNLLQLWLSILRRFQTQCQIVPESDSALANLSQSTIPINTWRQVRLKIWFPSFIG
jgi:hypothetical protein